MSNNMCVEPSNPVCIDPSELNYTPLDEARNAPTRETQSSKVGDRFELVKAANNFLIGVGEVAVGLLPFFGCSSESRYPGEPTVPPPPSPPPQDAAAMDRYVPPPPPPPPPPPRDAGSFGPFFIERISVDNNGNEGNACSDYPFISSDGRYVTFRTRATNLGALGGQPTIVIRDRVARTTAPVSIGYGNSPANNQSWHSSVDDAGQFVVFGTDATNMLNSPARLSQHYLRDVGVGVTLPLTYDPSCTSSMLLDQSGASRQISANGRFVVWNARICGGPRAIYVLDRMQPTSDLVSIGPDGNLLNSSGSNYSESISRDGRFVTFTSGYAPAEVYVRDRQTNTTTQASVTYDGSASDGDSYYGSSSDDGRFTAFVSSNTKLVRGVSPRQPFDVYVRDRQMMTTEFIPSPAVLRVNWTSISGDGRFVAFAAGMIGYGSGNTIVYDRRDRVSQYVNVGVGGLSDRYNGQPSISNDGRFIVFSDNGNLVNGDTNGTCDVFVVGLSYFFAP